MTDETYNGWSNYPTWAVNLWLSNDEGLYSETLDRVAHVTDGYCFDQYTTENVPGQVANVLRDWVRDELTPDLGATFAADLLGYALDCVDWYEVADAWMDGEATTEVNA